MNIKEELRINGHQPVVGYKGTEMGDIFECMIKRLDELELSNNVYLLMSQAYTYGVIQGKRAERTKRKEHVTEFKAKRAIMLLLSEITEKELKEMLQEDIWTEGLKRCVRQEFEMRKAGTQYEG